MSDKVPIPRRFRPFAADKGPWLIWSMHWNCWHRRGSEGGASGYTSNILEAGVFEEKTARGYHDTGPPKHRRDVTIPAHKAIRAMEHALAHKRAELGAYEARVTTARAAFLGPPHET